MYNWRLAGVQDGAPLVWRPLAGALNVKQYGAKGNGVTDDSKAIAYAVYKAQQSPTGGVVFFPPGRYLLNRTLTITKPNVVLRGAGQGRSTIYIPSSLSDVLGERWTTNGKARKSAYAFMGGFITFAAPEPRSNASFTFLTIVPTLANVTQFSRRIPVARSARVEVGQWVRIFINDASTSGSCDHLGFCRRRKRSSRKRRRALLVDTEAGGVSESAGGDGNHSASLLVERSRSRGLLADGARHDQDGDADDSDHADFEASAPLARAEMPGQGPTFPNDPAMTPPWLPRQVLPAQAQAQGSPGDVESAGKLEAAASPGSIAYWLYGNGLSRSGGGNLAVDRDTVSFTAKVVSKDATSITLDRPLPFPIRPGWNGVVHRLVAPLQASGVERLTVEFVWTKARQHLNDRGYNAFQFQGVRNCWVRNVTILNCDNGINFHSVDHSTIMNVEVGVTRVRVNGANPSPHNVNGHHSITLYHGHSNLVTRVNIAATYSHDITVARVTMLNAITRARGYNLCLDHHRGGPFGNLFSDIDLGCGFRPFGSSGLLENGANSGRGEMFYNVRATKRCPPLLFSATPATTLGWSSLPPCDFGPYVTFVGKFSGANTKRCPKSGWYFVPLGALGGQRAPDDLHMVQREGRVDLSYVSTVGTGTTTTPLQPPAR